MQETQAPRVQHLPHGAEHGRVFGSEGLRDRFPVRRAVPAVELIAEDRMAGVGEVNPDLVKPPGSRPREEEGFPGAARPEPPSRSPDTPCGSRAARTAAAGKAWTQERE